MSLGRRLAAARAERGLELEDVSRATRIRAPILRALEADDLAAAGPPVYVRGHLRTLAGVLGLDPAELVDEYERGAPSEPGVPQTWQVRDPAVARADRRTPNWLGAMVVTMAAVVALLVVGVLVEQPDDQVAVTTPPAATGPPAPAPPAPDGTPPPVPEAPSDGDRDPVDQVAADPTPGRGSVAGGSASGGSSAPAAPAPVGVRVAVDDGRSWLEVRDDGGRTLHAAVLERGEAEEFTAERELRLTVGDASAVRVEVGGRPVDVPGGEGDVARLVVRPGGEVTTG